MNSRETRERAERENPSTGFQTRSETGEYSDVSLFLCSAVEHLHWNERGPSRRTSRVLRDELQPLVCISVEEDSLCGRIMTHNTQTHNTQHTSKPVDTPCSSAAQPLIKGNNQLCLIYGAWSFSAPAHGREHTGSVCVCVCVCVYCTCVVEFSCCRLC